MTHVPITPSVLHPPFSNYNHGMLVRSGADLLFASGQLGIDQEGNIPQTAKAQAELCFQNIADILTDAEMGFGDIVRINAFVTSQEAFQDYMAVRNRYIKEPFPASTLVIVSGFARPEFQVEVEIIAARKPKEQGA